jgi:hypothetical protein
MSTTGQLILIHVCIGGMVWFCLATIRGRMADRTYDARMSTPLRFFLMPGRLADRAVWVRQQRVMAWIGLVFCGVVYVLAMIKTYS